MSRLTSPKSSAPIQVDPVEGHRLWAGTYDAGINPLLALEQRVLQPHLRGLAGKRFVDVGCGTGRWLLFAGQAGAEAFGVDLTREMLAQAAVKPGLKSRVVRSDAASLPFSDAAADVAISSFCISYVEDPSAVFAALARITKPGGRIIVSDIHPGTAKAGWKRTFRGAGRLYEMKIATRHENSLLQAGLDAGLTLSLVLEPCFGEAERPLFEKVGKLDAYETAAAVPALLIALWDRPE